MAARAALLQGAARRLGAAPTVHVPVLLEEAVGLLVGGRPPGAPLHLLDGTFGGGGHTAALLEAGRGVRVLALDRDPAAAARAAALSAVPEVRGRLTFERRNFREVGRAGRAGGGAGAAELLAFDGVLFDFGAPDLPPLDLAARVTAVAACATRRVATGRTVLSTVLSTVLLPSFHCLSRSFRGPFTVFTVCG